MEGNKVDFTSINGKKIDDPALFVPVKKVKQSISRPVQ